ncbi:MAG: hypothetical protein D6820_12000 [Lentisphaerae bacterium]|nr:MAG: hypothetical protein D6820_12000 [Lentisphaerota bacterium]
MKRSTEKKSEIVFLLGGLGAGKTTFLNRLLRTEQVRQQKVCLLINEFGEIGVDGQLIEDSEFPLFELNKGSLFCACVRSDFVSVMSRITAELQPDLIIAEATGMAEPRDLEDFIDASDLRQALQIRGHWTLIDSRHFIRQVAFLRAIREQVYRADILILNKLDLVSAKEVQQIKDVVRSINAAAPLVEARYGEVHDLSGFWRIEHRRLQGDCLQEPPDPVFSRSWRFDKCVNWEKFRQMVEKLGDHILRLKGHIDFGFGPEFVEVVGGEILRRPPVGSVADGRCEFVTIHWRIRESEIDALFHEITESV